jgi:hypothetical protein
MSHRSSNPSVDPARRRELGRELEPLKLSQADLAKNAAAWAGASALVNHLHVALNSVLTDPAIRGELINYTADLRGSDSPMEFAAFMESENAWYCDTIKFAGAKAE